MEKQIVLGYIFLNDAETFSPLQGSLFVNEDNGAFDLQKLLQRVAADAPHFFKECEVECPESVLDELKD